VCWPLFEVSWLWVRKLNLLTSRVTGWWSFFGTLYSPRDARVLMWEHVYYRSGSNECAGNPILLQLYYGHTNISTTKLYQPARYPIIFDIWNGTGRKWWCTVIITSLNNGHCRSCRSSEKSVLVLAMLWNRRAWWNTCPGPKYPRGGE